MDSEELAKQRWDVIIVGTGMGGATLGFELAKAGRKVLFCEKGLDHNATPGAIRGQYAEMHFPAVNASPTQYPDIMSRSGRWVDEIEDVSEHRTRRYVPFIGSGIGGSSSLYGMALERFYEEDFQPSKYLRSDEGATLVERWPIAFEELRPFYCEIEKLFQVRGDSDPLRLGSLDPLLPATPITSTSEELFNHFKSKNLNVYRLPLAADGSADCIGCQGFLCPTNCKKDAANTCLRPAVDNFGAKVLGGCRVNRLLADRDNVKAVECLVQGKELLLKGDTIVLAAGALESPTILLRSANETWPNGLANGSGLVGRNLMRHYVDLYAVAIRSRDTNGIGLKQIALNDLYLTEGFKGGTIQSFGALPPASMIVASLEKDMRDKGLGWLVPGFKLAKPILRSILDRKLSRSVVLATIMEDLPFHENCVTPHVNAATSHCLIGFRKARKLALQKCGNA